MGFTRHIQAHSHREPDPEPHAARTQTRTHRRTTVTDETRVKRDETQTHAQRAAQALSRGPGSRQSHDARWPRSAALWPCMSYKRRTERGGARSRLRKETQIKFCDYVTEFSTGISASQALLGDSYGVCEVRDRSGHSRVGDRLRAHAGPRILARLRFWFLAQPSTRIRLRALARLRALVLARRLADQVLGPK